MGKPAAMDLIRMRRAVIFIGRPGGLIVEFAKKGNMQAQECVLYAGADIQHLYKDG